MPVLWVPATGSISPRTVAIGSTGPTLRCPPSGLRYSTAEAARYYFAVRCSKRSVLRLGGDPAGSANTSSAAGRGAGRHCARVAARLGGPGGVGFVELVVAGDAEQQQADAD